MKESGQSGRISERIERDRERFKVKDKATESEPREKKD